MIRRLSCLLVVCLISAGCGVIGPKVLPSQSVVPYVVQKGGGAQWVQFAPHTGAFLYGATLSGPDGNVWFLEENQGALVRISVTGATKEFPIGVDGIAMAVGADSKFYVLDASTHVTQ